MSFGVQFYKGTHTGIQGLYNRAVRLWTVGEYSHAEILFSDGLSASSSFMDGGVRFKYIEYSKPENWDFIELPDVLEFEARKWFERHSGEKYDLLGNVHFIVPPIRDEKNKWSCAESVMAALEFNEAWRFEPNNAAVVLKFIGA